MRRPEWLVLAVFVTVVFVGGSNFVAVRFSDRELPPFWAATVRFAVAAALLFALSLLAREAEVLPTLLATWIALAYLVLSTLVLFVGFLFVVQRWAASATSYATVLFPLVTVAVGAILASEQCRSPSSRAPPS